MRLVLAFSPRACFVYLIVSGAASVHASTNIHAKSVDDLLLDVHVDVLLLWNPGPLAFIEFILELEQCVQNSCSILSRDDSLGSKHAHMGKGTPDVLSNHVLVCGDGLCPAEDRLVNVPVFFPP